MSDVPRPDREDPQFAPFWEGTDVGELRVQRCSSCQAVRWPPRPMCAACHSTETDWVAVAPRGTVYSWVGVEHQTARGLPSPYVLGLVELDDAPVRMLGRLVGIDRSGAAIGARVVAEFQSSESGVMLVNWRQEDPGHG